MFGFEFPAMASACEIRLAAPEPQQARQLADQAIAQVRRIEHKYSRYRADSIVGRINAAAGQESICCDEETLALFDFAQTLYESSDGLFDITSGVLRQVWDFREPRVPSQEQLATVLSRVDWRLLGRDGANVGLKRAGMEVDFGGFGKEYAADRAAACLIEAGVSCGFVNLGGDLRIIGPQPDGSPWRIGIQDPRDGAATVAAIDVGRGAMATSGDYERYFELDGHRYCHILNPRTGRPVCHWRSVTVLAPLAIAAGSCATVAMLKEADGLEFLDATGYAFLAIDGQGNRFRREEGAPGITIDRA